MWWSDYYRRICSNGIEEETALREKIEKPQKNMQKTQ
jgi:hypothetical protein